MYISNIMEVALSAQSKAFATGTQGQRFRTSFGTHVVGVRCVCCFLSRLSVCTRAEILLWVDALPGEFY